MKDGKVRFIRKNGRVIPVKAKSGDSSKKLPKVKKIISNKKARQAATGAGGLAGMFGMLKKFKSKTALQNIVIGGAGFIGGSLLASSISNIKYTKKAVGETDFDTAKRVSMGNKKYSNIKKKSKN